MGTPALKEPTKAPASGPSLSETSISLKLKADDVSYLYTLIESTQHSGRFVERVVDLKRELRAALVGAGFPPV